MNDNYSQENIGSARKIVTELTQGRIEKGMELLRVLKEEIYDAIPVKKRQSQGITWVVQRISALLAEVCEGDLLIREIALVLSVHLPKDDLIMGAPIFLMGEYGKRYPTEVYEFFEKVAASENWVVREFAQAGFRQLILPNREIVHSWLKETAQKDDPYLRRFVSETLRPVAVNRWMNGDTEYSLRILGSLFRELHPYPRTSVGNNLSDLSRRNPDRIFSIVRELVEMGDKNSYWIAYRACRNLVKQHPLKVMDLLGVDEYHYKDRNSYRF